MTSKSFIAALVCMLATTANAQDVFFDPEFCIPGAPDPSTSTDECALDEVGPAGLPYCSEFQRGTGAPSANNTTETGPIVASKSADGNWDIHDWNIKTSLKDGTEVHKTQLVENQDGFFMLRYSVGRTEIIPLEDNGDALRPGRAKKIKVCFQLECPSDDTANLIDTDEVADSYNGNNDNFGDAVLNVILQILTNTNINPNQCNVDLDLKSCHCSKSDDECLFGFDNQWELHDWIVID